MSDAPVPTQASQAPVGAVAAPDWGTVIVATRNDQPNEVVDEAQAQADLEALIASLDGVDVQKHGIYPGSTPQVSDAALTADAPVSQETPAPKAPKAPKAPAKGK